MELRSVFIQNLKRSRKDKKISQMKLAELCSTSTNYIGEIEIGKKFPSIDMIQKISDALEIDAYRLFMDTSVSMPQCMNVETKTKLIQKIQQSVEEIINNEA